MKAKQYLIAGALMLSLSTPLSAQEADYQSQLKTIESALKANPDSKETQNLVKTFTKDFKKDPKALVALGYSLMAIKNYDKATELANTVIAKNKNYGDAYVLLGDIQVMKDDGGDAAMWYQQAMTMDPKNPAGYMNLAKIYRKVSPDEAAEALNKLKAERPDYPIDAEAGNDFYSAGNYEKAYEYFSKTDKNTLKEYYLFEYATTDYILRKYEESLDLAQLGVQKFPKSVSFARLGLWNAVELQKYDLANQYAEAIMKDASIKKTARDYNYYGRALRGEKRYDEAIAAFNEALSIDTKDFKPYQDISETYAAMGNEDKALEYSQTYLDKSDAVKPSDFAKLANIYLAKVKKGEDKEANFDKAVGVYNKMAEKWPSLKAWTLLQAGIQATQNGYDDKGATYLQECIDLLEAKGSDITEDEKSSLISAYENIGFYYWGTKNDLEAAKPYYQKLIQLNPESKNAKRALGLDQPAEEETTGTGAAN